MANARLRRIMSCASASRLMQTSNRGGSTVSEHTEVAVRPARRSPRPDVTMVTPAARRRIPAMKWEGGTGTGGGLHGGQPRSAG